MPPWIVTPLDSMLATVVGGETNCLSASEVMDLEPCSN